MNTRQKYYNLFMGDNSDLTDYATWCKTVWFYPTGAQIRLNSLGLELFSQQLPHHTVLIPEDHRKAKHYLFLSKYCREPYFIEPGRAVFFDEQEAMVFRLCDGDFDNFDEINGG